MHGRRHVAFTLALGVALVACGGDGGRDDVPAATDVTDLADAADVTTAPGGTTGEVAGGVDDPPDTADGASTPATAPSPTSASTDGDGPTAAAPEILRFSAPTVGGGSLDLSAIGERPVLLWFWAPF